MKHPEFSDSLVKAAQEMADGISDSACMLTIFDGTTEFTSKHLPGLIQMGLSIYLDKPVYLILPKSLEHKVPNNLRKIVTKIEMYDDSLPMPLRESAVQAATHRLLEEYIKK